MGVKVGVVISMTIVINKDYQITIGNCVNDIPTCVDRRVNETDSLMMIVIVVIAYHYDNDIRNILKTVSYY